MVNLIFSHQLEHDGLEATVIHFLVYILKLLLFQVTKLRGHRFQL